MARISRGLIDLSLDGAFNIVGDSRRSTDPSTGQTRTLQWPTMSATPAYDDTVPR